MQTIGDALVAQMERMEAEGMSKRERQAVGQLQAMFWWMS